jgi:hypothetical protein
MSVSGQTPSELLIARLGSYLGPDMARSAVNTFCKRQVGVAPESLKSNQVLLVLPSLKAMLTTLVGTTNAQNIVAQLSQELSR